MSDVIHSSVIELSVESSGVDAGMAKINGSAAKMAEAMNVAGKKAADGIVRIGTASDATAEAVTRVTEKVARTVGNLGKTVGANGKEAADSIGKIGDGGGAAAAKVERATKNISDQIQRTIAVMSSGARGSAEYYAALANSRGANTETLQPFIDQLTEVTSRSIAAAEAQRKLDEGSKFLDDLQSKADNIGKTASELAKMRAEQLGVADAAAPMIQQLMESEGAMTGVAGAAIELATALGAAIAAQQLMAGIKDVTLAAGKYEQMGIVMDTLGKNTGYTAGELAKVQSELERTGISMAESRQTIGTMVSANIELADATKLARLAQDAAAIAQTSSSEAMNRLINGIQTAQVEVLRTMGLNVNFEKGYAKLAGTLHKSVEELSEQEKMQSRVNSAMEKAPTIAGAYAASMESATKQMGSLSRYADNAAVSIGQAFQPVFGVVIKSIGETLKFTASNANIAAIGLSAAAGGVLALTLAVAGLTIGTRAFAAASALVSANPWVIGLTVAAAAVAGLVAWYGTWKNASNEATKAIETNADRAIAAAKKTSVGIGESVNEITENLKKLTDDLNKTLGIEPNKLEGIRASYAAQAKGIAELGRQLMDAQRGEGSFADMPAKARQEAAEKMKKDMLVNAADMATASAMIVEAQDKTVRAYTQAQGRMTDAQKMQAGFVKAEKEHADALLEAGGDLKKVAAINAAYKTEIADIKKSNSKESTAATSKEETANNSLAAAVKALTEESKLALATGADATAAQKIRIKLDQDLLSGKVLLSAADKAARYRDIDALEVALQAEKYSKDQVKFYADLAQSKAEAASAAILAADSEVEKNEMLVRTFGMTKQAIEELELARLEERRAQIDSTLQCTLEAAALDELIDAKKRNIAATGILEELEAGKKSTEEAGRKQIEIWKSVDQTAHDTFVNVFQNGKSAFDKLRDTLKSGLLDLLYQMTVKKWIFQIGASVTGSTGIAGMAQASGLGGVGASGGSAMSLLQTAKGAYDAISTGFTGLAASVGGMVGTVGSFFGSSSVAAFGAGMGMTGAQAATAAGLYGEAGMASTGSALTAGSATGAAAAAAAGIVGGVYGGRAISGQYGSNSTVNAGTAIGAVVGSIVPVIGTAIGALLGGLLGGVANRLFGMGDKKVTEQGITGSLGASGFTGNAYAKWHQDGGYFRSDDSGTTPSALDAATSTALGDGYKALQTVSSGFAKTLGINADSIATRTQALNLVLTKDSEANKKVFADFFQGVGDSMANELVPSLAQFALANEAASTTLQRIAGDYQVVDLVLATLGKTSQQAFGAVGIASVTARERLIAAAGSMAALASGTAYFASNFLSPAEQMAPIIKSVEAQLAGLGAAGVKTNDQFKALVLGLNLSSDAGAKQYAELLLLAPQFKQMTDYTSGLADAMKESADVLSQRTDLLNQLDELTMTSTQLHNKQRAAIDASNRGLWDQVQAALAAKAAQDSAKSALQGVIDKTMSFGDSLRSFRDGLQLGDMSTLTPEQKYAEAQAQYERTLAAAKGGDSAAQGNLQSVANAFLSASKLVNASDEKYRSDYMRVLQSSDDTIKWAATQVDIGKASLAALNKQVLGLADINAGVLTMTQAIQNWVAAMGMGGARMSPSVDGSHATGLEYVPFNNYSANTHEGEAIVDAPAMAAMRRYFGRAPSLGGGNADALVAEIKGLREEVKALRADQRAQTGALIDSNDVAHERSANKVVAGSVKAAEGAAWAQQSKARIE